MQDRGAADSKRAASRQAKDVYQDIAYPITRQFRQELYEEIVKEFNDAMEKEG